MSTPSSSSSRRRFLKTSVATAAAPFILPSGLLRAQAPSNRINMALVGSGSRGTGVMKGFLQKPGTQVVAVCDVAKDHKGSHKGAGKGLLPAKEAVEKHYAGKTESGTYKGCEAYHDFRELCARDDIDAVIVGTPDHWHALAALEAVRNGKDVYCEKPVTHLFREGQVLYQEVAKHKAIFQTGSQQRSDQRFHRAAEIVQNGLLGKVHRVEVGLPGGRNGADGNAGDTTIPDTLDYDFYTGPSPELPYNSARCHWSWRWHTNFGGGQLMDWIGHHNDCAHWAMGWDKSGPLSVQSTGWKMYSGADKIYDTPEKYEVKCTYPDGVETSIGSVNKMGITFRGEDDAWLYVTRGKIEASNPEWIAETFDRGPIKPYKSPGHHDNFLDGIRERAECIAPAETAHRSITPGHLGWLSHYLGGRELKWDAATETITGDAEADAMLKKIDYRGDWKLEA